MKVKSQSEVAQSCPTLRNPMDCSPPGSSIHGIFQARVLEWGAIAFSGSVTQSYPILRNHMDCSTPGFPVHHHLPEPVHVHGVSDGIQLSHPLSSPSPPAFYLSQHQGLLRPEVKAGTGEHFHGVRGSELRFRVLQLTGERVHGVRGSEQWHHTPVLLPGKSHGWRSLVGCSPWGR